MSERAHRTVTFVFTDVEGSTGLLKQLRAAYGDVLAEHQRIVREAFAAHGGEEIDTQGDAFFYVFPRARQAALAAAAAQRALASHSWPAGVTLRIRIGMHTAEPDISDEGRYHGLGVHRTARIMAAGHGGQILVSQATASMLADDELPGMHLRYLGEYVLKDLDHAERIYQLEVEGLRQRFPPLDTATLGFWTGRRLAAAGAGVAVVVAAAAGVLALVLGDSAQGLPHVDANAVGLIDAETGEISEQIDVGAAPTHIAVGEGSIWVTNGEGDSVSRIDPAKKTVVQTAFVGSTPSGITTGAGSVWVANSLSGTVSRIDPETNQVVEEGIPVGNFPVGILYAEGAIWVANTGDETVTRIDPNGEDRKTLPIAATELAYGAGTLWATQRMGNRVVRIDPQSRQVVQSIVVGNGPTGVAFGSGAAWVANALDGTVSRVDPRTNSTQAVIPVGNGPTAVAVGSGGVWVSNQYEGTLARIDPGTNRVTHFRVGNRPHGVALSGDYVLVSVRESGARHRGGTLTVRMSREPDSIDPAAAYDTASWPILRMTNDGLVAFNQAAGLAGTQLVPNLAVSLPAPTNGGKTYTFRLRSNIRYSTGRLVEPSDFRATFERLFKVGKLLVGYYDGIVGVAQCKRRPKSCDLARGIVADDTANTVAFHLVAADPEFLYKLALSFTYVLPEGTPPTATGTRPLPATGPYVIESYRPKRLIRLVRNPHFREWSQAAQPDGYPAEIRFVIGGTADGAVTDVLRGQADVFSSSLTQIPPSANKLSELRVRYASRLRTNPQAATIGLFLNTREPPFDRVAARRAVNYAASRPDAVEALGGSDLAQATCQILPPYFPGYRQYCPYAVGRRGTPDLARARALVGASGTRGTPVVVWSWGDHLPQLGAYAVKLLRSLGYRPRLVNRIAAEYYGAVGDTRANVHVGPVEWITDYPAASGFFNPILSCASFLPNSPANSNWARFCDRRLDRQINKAFSEQVTNPGAARGLWERIDKQTVDAAPWVPLVNRKAVDVLAKRVGNYQYSPHLGLLIDQLWVR